MKKDLLIFALVITLFVSCKKNEYYTFSQSGDNAIILEKYCALGASTASMPWQAEVSKKVALSYKCYALGGARWAHTTTSVLDYSDNASANANNNLMTNQLIRLIKDKNENGYYPDLITLMCGLNDAANGPNIIGNYDDTFALDMTQISMEDWFIKSDYKKYRQNVYGSARFVIENIVRNFPKTQIVLCTLQQCNNGSYSYQNILATNTALEKIANRYSIPIIDFFRESGITDAGGLITQYLREDGIHPNAAGEILMTNFLTQRLREIYFTKHN